MVLDTSAILAIMQDEPERHHFNELIASSPSCLMSAATFLESGTVLQARYGSQGVVNLKLFVASAEVEIIPFDKVQAGIAAAAYAAYGKGFHSAGLNFGDCMSYALSKKSGEPLLFKGDDFIHTDIQSVSHGQDEGSYLHWTPLSFDPPSYSTYYYHMKHDGRFPCINLQGELTMSLLELPCTLVGPKGRRTVTALFDSGASVSCIRRELAEELAHPEVLAEAYSFETADEGELVTADHAVLLDFFLEDAPRRFHDEFFILNTLSEDLIIGATTMQKWNIKLDFENEAVSYSRKMDRLRI